ncbi:hypothetical protein GOM49_05230 [Clostridium bovifaecis]|uniref:histidine kinase n=1 Tax=Clostridium bovifaecis TaxID=2184719 RepID=A0A6I6F2C9_9CLOT|nr:hypothetical protein GOM49_05230 [Clostridium bovifaecis]
MDNTKNINRRRRKLYAMLLSILIIFVHVFKSSANVSVNRDINGKEEHIPIAKDGVLDLRDWDFKNDGIIKLDGNWEFYENELLSPRSFNERREKKYVKLPGSYGSFGYGTYRLKLLMNEAEDIYSVKVEFLQSAYKLWANDMEISSVGIVGKSKEEMVPQLLPSTGTFYNSSNEVYLTLQASNFYAKHGLTDTIILGKTDQVSKLTTAKLAFDMFLFGGTLIAAIYNLGLFLKRRKEKSTLYFAIVCIIISVRTLFLGQRFFIYMNPAFSYILSGKIMHWTFYLYMPFVVLFIHSFYKGILDNWVLKFSNAAAYVYAILIVIFPWKYYMNIVAVFEFITVLLLIYLIFKLSRIYIRRDRIDYITIIALFSLLVTRINDILYEYSIIITASFASLGVLIFIIANCYLIAERQSMAFSKVEYLVEKALNLTRQVYDVKEEVENLNSKNEEKEKQVKELLEYDKLKTEFFTNISHELRTPLNVISSTIQLLQSIDNKKELGDEKIKYYFSIIDRNSLRLLRIINNLLDITKVDGQYLSLNLTNENIVYIVEDITQSVAEYIRAKNISITFDTEVEEKIIAVDEEKVERIMLNILSNAVKFTDENGSIFVNIYDKGEFVEISISDTGIGIPEDKLDYIFGRFAQVDKSTTRNNEGSGIGLALVESLVKLHNGKIYVESKLGEGTKFTIQLPNITVDQSNSITEKNVSGLTNDKKLSLEFSDIYM